MRVYLEELECQDALTLYTGNQPSADEAKNNRKAYMKLALACDDEVSFALVKKSTSTNYPNGDAAAAWKALQN